MYKRMTASDQIDQSDEIDELLNLIIGMEYI